MRISTPCMKCQQELGAPDGAIYHPDLLDQVIAKFECRNGHKVVCLVQSHKFEILAELAVNAIFDGYYREAISSFTSSLERFYELYLKVVFRSKKLDGEEYDQLWKRVKIQSERQFGAFNFVYFLEEGALPDTLSNARVSFRNRVIHQGQIPTREQAIEYGQAVVDVIRPAMEKLASGNIELLAEIQREEMFSSLESAGLEFNGSTLSMATLLSFSRGNISTVQDWLIHVEKSRGWYK